MATVIRGGAEGIKTAAFQWYYHLFIYCRRASLLGNQTQTERYFGLVSVGMSTSGIWWLAISTSSTVSLSSNPFQSWCETSSRLYDQHLLREITSFLDYTSVLLLGTYRRILLEVILYMLTYLACFILWLLWTHITIFSFYLFCRNMKYGYHVASVLLTELSSQHCLVYMCMSVHSIFVFLCFAVSLTVHARMDEKPVWPPRSSFLTRHLI